MINHKEMGRFITTTEQLAPYIHMSEEEKGIMNQILDTYPMAIPPYYLSLIDFADPEDPIRRMCIPSIKETNMDGSFDTSGESRNTVETGIQHKYGATALVLTTSQCAMYCRHCFRKRLVGLRSEEIMEQSDQMVEYIKSNKEISNVLLTGGDSFLIGAEIMEQYLHKLTSIPHLDFIRFGTRTPVVMPALITQDKELLAVIKKYNKKKPIYIVTQFNHPRELTEEARAAIQALKDTGVSIKNQTVLLRGVNDDPEVLGELLRKMTQWGIAPYYVFQCRPVSGVKSQFQVPLKEGYRIVEEAKKTQNGFGKAFRFIMSHPKGKIEILGPAGEDQMLFKYHQAKDPVDTGRLFTIYVSPDTAWLGDIPE